MTTHAGIQFCDQAGRVNGIIAKPQNKWLANVVFGGANLDELYVCCSDILRKALPYAVQQATLGVLSAEVIKSVMDSDQTREKLTTTLDFRQSQSEGSSLQRGSSNARGQLKLPHGS